MADMLHIKGKIVPVLACGRMGIVLDRKLALLTGDGPYARETKVPEDDTDKTAPIYHERQARQLLCPITAPTVAGGWGTFERSDLLQLQSDGKRYLVHALQISTRNYVENKYLYGPIGIRLWASCDRCFVCGARCRNSRSVPPHWSWRHF